MNKVIKAFFITHGQKETDPDIFRLQDMHEGSGVANGAITNPIEFIASALGRGAGTVSGWSKYLRNGVSASDPDKLEPMIAFALIALADTVLMDNNEPLATNTVKEMIYPKIEDYYRSSK